MIGLSIEWHVWTTTMWSAALLAFVSPAAAQPVPKVGTCPSGYHPSGGYCAPVHRWPRLPKRASARPDTTRAAAIVLARETLATPCIGSAHARWATM